MFLPKMYCSLLWSSQTIVENLYKVKGVSKAELPRLYAVLCGGARINETEYSFDHYEIQCFNQDKNP